MAEIVNKIIDGPLGTKLTECPVCHTLSVDKYGECININHEIIPRD